MSEQPIKVGDWVMVASSTTKYDRSKCKPARVCKVTPKGGIRVSGLEFRLFKPESDDRWRADNLNSLRRSTSAEITEAEVQEAKEKAAQSAAEARCERARQWLAAYDWTSCKGGMPAYVASQLGWKDDSDG